MNLISKGTEESMNLVSKKMDDETILINCNKLVKQGWIYDKQDKYGKYSKHGKYRLVEHHKIPSFLTFRSRNRLFKTRLLHYIFKQNGNSFDDISKNIGIYLLYILIETLRPNGPNTTEWLDSKDPRINNKDLLRDTWLKDTIDPNLILEHITKYSNLYDYHELIKMFECTFPGVHKKIVFHEKIKTHREESRYKKKQKPKILDEDEIYEEFTENSQNWLKYLSQ